MNKDERLDYAIGQIASLKAFCISLIVEHPDPAALEMQFARAVEIGVANTLPSQASEAIISGSESISLDLLKVLRGEAARRAGRLSDGQPSE